MSTLIIQPSDADAYLQINSPDVNAGSTTDININKHSGDIQRIILNFDFSVLPTNVFIGSATLSLYYYNWLVSNPSGRTYWAYRVTQTAWTEGGVTWNKYDGVNNWTLTGGDFTTTYGASIIVPSSTGQWINWNVLNQVIYARNNTSDVAHFLIKDSDESVATHSVSQYYSNNYTTDTTLRPKLTIFYFVPNPLNFTKLYSGVKEVYFNDGWDNEKYFFVEQANPFPCTVQFVDLYVDTTNE